MDARARDYSAANRSSQTVFTIACNASTLAVASASTSFVIR